MMFQVILIGGASGTGKTSVSYPLAHQLAYGVVETDDLVIAVKALTTLEQQPELHHWDHLPEGADLTPEDIVTLHLRVARVLLPALLAVIENHLEDGPSCVLEGAYLLPELVRHPRLKAALESGRLAAVFLHELDEAQIVRNYHAREPEAGKQSRRAQVSVLLNQ